MKLFPAGRIEIETSSSFSKAEYSGATADASGIQSEDFVVTEHEPRRIAYYE